MNALSERRVKIVMMLAGCLAAAALALTPASVRGQTHADFRVLMAEWRTAMMEGNLAEAERVADRMYRWAKGPLAHLPLCLATASDYRGITYRLQKRYDEAEPLHKQSLEILRKELGQQHPLLIQGINSLGTLYSKQGRHAEAERLYRQALAVRRKVHGDEHRDIASSLSLVADACASGGRHAEAEPLLKEALRIRRKQLGDEHLDVAQTLSHLADVVAKLGRHEEAEPLYEQALQIRRNLLGDDHPTISQEFGELNSQCWDLIRGGRYDEAERLAKRLHRWAIGPLAREPLRLADACSTLGRLYDTQGRYADAEPLYRQTLDIRRKVLGDEHPHVAWSLSNLAVLYRDQGRYAEAELLHEEALRVERKAYGDEHPHVALSVNNLATLYCNQGRYAEAEPLYKQALAMRRKLLGDEHSSVGDSLNDLALLYCYQGRYAEAEPLYGQALETRRNLLGDEHPRVADSLGGLAILYANQAHYAEAEPLYRQALGIYRKTFGDEHPQVAQSLGNLGNLYYDQGRYAEAEPLYRESLRIYRTIHGEQHRDVAWMTHALALCLRQQARDAEAERLCRQALEIYRMTLGKEHPAVANSLNSLALSCVDQGRYGEAEPLYQQALEIDRKALGDEHPHVAIRLNNLASLYIRERRYAKAERLLDEAEQIAHRGFCDPLTVARIHWHRGRLFWHTERKPHATEALEQALQALEQQRTQVAGGELERAEFFGRWTRLFELMVAWQHELDQPAEVLDAMERSRARSLLDQMQTAGLDLLAGVPPETVQRLRRQESEAAGRVAELRKQLEVLPTRDDLSAEEKEEERERLLEELHQAQLDYTRAYAETRSASPAYRLAISDDQKPVSAEELARWVEGRRALLLQYLLGDEAGYVYIQPAGGEPRVVKLELTTEQAAALGVEPGPLTAQRMGEILMRKDETGVLDHLRESRDSRREQQAVDGLAVLWEVLVPEAERKALVEGEYKRLVALPDAALALLPFETLVVEAGERPRDHKYLLDVGPPVVYAPSATILVNLAERQDEAKQPAEQPVLSIGDCRYGPSAAPADTLLADLAPQTRYAAVGGHLAPLKYAAWEVQWVADVFRKRGVQPALLRGEAAREVAVQRHAPGRRILHFATHGLVDQQYGNLFGALALTPGPRPDDPADDGFLTLAEIYELDLAGCELAILSACDTNVGPHQRGEGVWSLARGFLTAGARRVAATTWLLDDRVAASTVSYFCSGIAQQKASGEPVDYAAALHEAKRWARSQDEWAAPYYWAPMVLIGPE